MAVDRKVFTNSFRKSLIPEWTCPSCEKGILKGKSGSFVSIETRESRSDHINPAWEPEWMVRRYSCQFICTNPSCEEMVFNIGKGTIEIEVDFDDTDGYTTEYLDTYTPLFFYPHLNIFKLPPATPRDIKSNVNASFEMFFVNPSAAVNHLRIALEKLLDHLKVKRFETKDNKRYPISLHRRIHLVPNRVADLKELLLAVKWLGNEGSHDGGVTKDSVMDAYDIFESILSEIFGRNTKEIRKLAKKINKKRK